jgi:plasmid maintenance system antidote protein VapI
VASRNPNPNRFDLLADWMKAKKVSQAELARRVRRPRRDINRLCTGRLKFIDPKLAVAIERETAGDITAADFINFAARQGQQEPV